MSLWRCDLGGGGWGWKASKGLTDSVNHNSPSSGVVYDMGSIEHCKYSKNMHDLFSMYWVMIWHNIGHEVVDEQAQYFGKRCF